MLDQVGFIGLGLIGGSIAKALKIKSIAKSIVAYDIDKDSLTQAYNDSIVDICANSIGNEFAHCDIIFLCCPVQVNIDMYNKLSSIVKKDCIITDVGSTKEDILDQVLQSKSSTTFIGGHPMAGSEKTSYAFSSPHLFENAYYIITPFSFTGETYVKKLYKVIKNIDAIPIVIPPDEHDFITATISHVPHIIAASMVNIVKELDSDNKYMHTLAANGFKDITRIASSSPEMWEQICLTNKERIIKVLDYFIENLNNIKTQIFNSENSNIYNFFNEARNYRDSFQERASHTLIESYEITVDVIDEPGIIARIASILSEHKINIKNIGIINNREHTKGVLEIVFADKISQQKSIKILTEMNFITYER